MDISKVIDQKIQELETHISALKSAKEVLCKREQELKLPSRTRVSSNELFSSRQVCHKQVYEYVLENPWKTPGQVAKAFGWKEQKVSDVVCRLQQRGLIVKRTGNRVRAYVPEVSDLRGKHVRK